MFGKFLNRRTVSFQEIFQCCFLSWESGLSVSLLNKFLNLSSCCCVPCCWAYFSIFFSVINTLNELHNATCIHDKNLVNLFMLLFTCVMIDPLCLRTGYCVPRKWTMGSTFWWWQLAILGCGSSCSIRQWTCSHLGYSSI